MADDRIGPALDPRGGTDFSHNLFLGGYCARLIENSCHWTLDVTYREDDSRMRDKNLRENFAWLNRLTLSLLKQHPGRESIAMKRRSCGWSDDYLMEVITESRC